MRRDVASEQRFGRLALGVQGAQRAQRSIRAALGQRIQQAPHLDVAPDDQLAHVGAGDGPSGGVDRQLAQLGVEPTQVRAAQLRQLADRALVDIDVDELRALSDEARHVQNTRELAHERPALGNRVFEHARIEATVFDEHHGRRLGDQRQVVEQGLGFVDRGVRVGGLSGAIGAALPAATRQPRQEAAYEHHAPVGQERHGVGREPQASDGRVVARQLGQVVLAGRLLAHALLELEHLLVTAEGVLAVQDVDVAARRIHAWMRHGWV